MILSVGEVIPDFSTMIIVERKSQGGFDAQGRFNDGVSSFLEMEASVQPASPEDIKRVDEGRRTSEILKVYTLERLLPSSSAKQKQPDQITYQDILYEVESVEDWFILGGFFKSIVRKIGQ